MLSITQLLMSALLVVAPLHAHPTTISSATQSTQQCILLMKTAQDAHDTSSAPDLKLNLSVSFADSSALDFTTISAAANPAITKSVVGRGVIQTPAFASSASSTAKVLQIDFADRKIPELTYGALKWTTSDTQGSFQKPFCLEELVDDDKDIVEKHIQCQFQC
ncbi:hypothetical protein GGR57DRAFT_333986 [Xylariaceae sp. FL1272]|nr:hypothetical protein GGR57DRAFT_333986 [Xylariaceae sp. FL1272]